MSEKTNPTNDSDIMSRKPDIQAKWIGEYRDMFSFKFKPVTEMFLERLAQDLLVWARTEDAWVYSQFYNDKGISRSQYYEWMAKHEVLREAHDMAKDIIGTRRELKFKNDSNMVKPMMAFYKKDWKDMEEWRNKNKIEQVAADQRPIILGALQGVETEQGE